MNKPGRLENLEIETRIQILKPVHEVYEAIVDPAKMTNYFISKSSGRMEAGTTLAWEFPEFEGSFPVKVEKTEKGKYICYNWDGSDGKELRVEIILEEIDKGYTIVTVTEKSMAIDEAGINWLKNNTAGWANFLACLKAYLEYGINLRKGAFDFYIKPQ